MRMLDSLHVILSIGHEIIRQMRTLMLIDPFGSLKKYLSERTRNRAQFTSNAETSVVVTTKLLNY